MEDEEFLQEEAEVGLVFQCFGRLRHGASVREKGRF
jgi:hypothetical protein